MPLSSGYQCYIADLRELKDALGVKVYAYGLMTNHVHLLLASGKAIAGFGAVDESAGGAHHPLSEALRGTNRHSLGKSIQFSVVESDAYLPAVATSS